MSATLVEYGRTPAAIRRRAERDAAIVAMACNRIPPCEIAERMPGMKGTNIQRILAKARANGVPVPRFSSSGVTAAAPLDAAVAPAIAYVPIRSADLDALKHAAAARGMTTLGLATRLLERVIRDDLVDAVMDDRAAREAAGEEARSAERATGRPRN